jgi:autotransporter-associated beta strand protein
MAKLIWGKVMARLGSPRLSWPTGVLRGGSGLAGRITNATALRAIGLIAAWGLFLSTTTARAQFYWQIPSGDWSVPSNWGGALPSNHDDAYIVNAGTASISVGVVSCGDCTGALVLTNSNTYTGTTTISAGTLQIGNGGSGASIGSTVSVANSGTLIFNCGDSVNFHPAISGKGNLAQVGSGMVTLTGLSSYVPARGLSRKPAG